MTYTTCGNREDNDKYVPCDTDFCTLLNSLVRLKRHKSYDNMWHTEVTETPAKTGSDVLPVIKCIPVAFGKLNSCFCTATVLHYENSENRCCEQSGKHKHTLEEVCPANSLEATEEGVNKNNTCGKVHSLCRVNAENCVEQSSASLHT